MAIQVRQGKTGTTYRVYWNNPYSGAREGKSFKTFAEAKKYEALIKYQLEFEKERFIEPEPKEKKDNSLEGVFYVFLKERQFGKKSLEFQLDGMKKALSLLGRKDINAITHKDLYAVLQEEIARGVSAKTVHSRMSVLYALIRWAFKRGILDTLPRFPERPSYRNEKLVPPSENELTQILHFAPPHIQRVVVIGAKLGLRVGPCELLKLKWQDIDLDKGVVYVHAAKKNLQEPIREVPIMQALLPLFAQWKSMDAKLGIDHVIHFHGKPVQSIYKAWIATLKRAGITRKIRPYDLRHAFATDMISGGADLGTVANLMGHTSVQMVVKHYQHVATRQKRQAVEGLPVIEAGAFSCNKVDVPNQMSSLVQ